MKRSLYIAVSMFALSLTLSSAPWAAETKEERELQKEAAVINTTTSNAQGEKVVVQKLAKEFKITDTQIQGLRNQKLGYGEISIVLSLAQKMPGGVTDSNIQQIMTMRQGPPTMGWGEIAKKNGTRLGTVVSQVKNVHRETSREMKREARGEKDRVEKQREQREQMKGHEEMRDGQGMSRGKNK